MWRLHLRSGLSTVTNLLGALGQAHQDQSLRLTSRRIPYKDAWHQVGADEIFVGVN